MVGVVESEHVVQVHQQTASSSLLDFCDRKNLQVSQHDARISTAHIKRVRICRMDNKNIVSLSFLRKKRAMLGKQG